MAKTLIHYLSTLPGSGKTRLSNRRLRDHIRGGRGIMFYVAPTVDLLKEVRLALEKKLTEPQQKKIRFVVASRSMSIQRKVSGLLLGGTTEEGKFRKAAPGSVFLMTHEGFLRLPDNLPHKAEIDVVFDEARKFTAELQPVRLANAKEFSLFNDLLDNNSVDLLDRDGAATGFRRLRLDEWPKHLKSMTETVESRKNYSNLHSAVEAAMNSRTDLYVKMERSQKNFKFYEVVMPSRIFEGFKSVLLMAAFLEDSQMWHLLKSSKNIHLVSLLDMPENMALAAHFNERTIKIRKRFSYVGIFPLTEQVKPLSMTRLESAFMVPAALHSVIKASLEDLGMSSTLRLGELLERIETTEPTDAETKAVELLRSVKTHHNPFAWYMRAASKFLKGLRNEGKISGEILCVVNKKNHDYVSDHYPEWTRISSVSNGLNKYSDSNTLVFAAALNPNPKIAALYSSLLVDYNYALDHLADSCVQAVTRLCVRDTKSETVAYVVLPDTAMADLLRAKMLNRPIISMRAIDVLGSMVALSSLNPTRKRKLTTESVTERKSRRAASEKQRSKDRVKDPVAKQLASLRALRSYYSRKIRDEGESKKFTDKVDTLNREIKSLIK